MRGNDNESVREPDSVQRARRNLALMNSLDERFESIRERIKEGIDAGHEVWYEDKCGVRYLPPLSGKFLRCEPDGSYAISFFIKPANIEKAADPNCHWFTTQDLPFTTLTIPDPSVTVNAN